jgi:hypothetical protein
MKNNAPITIIIGFDVLETLVEKSIEISIGFLQRKLAIELHRVSMELHRNSPYSSM